MNNYLFDLDGTLTDPFQGISRCISYALEELGLPVPVDQALRTWIGPPLKGSFRKYFSKLQVEASADKALALYRRRFAEKGLYENRVYLGVPELLSLLLDRGGKIFLATSKPEPFARKILVHFDLSETFDGIYGSGMDGALSEKRDLLAYLLEQESLTAIECVMVGDRKHDILAGRHHGMKSFGVLWGYGDEQELRNAGAHELFPNVKALCDWVRKQ